MSANHIIFAGVDLSSGRKPVTFVALDGEMKIESLEDWSISEALSGLKEFKSIWLAVSMPAREQEIHTDFRKKIAQVGFQPYSTKNASRQVLETNAQKCFHALIGQTPMPRRTFEGRLQRALILYEQELQIPDPMEIFEEITRYKLMQGMLPLESLASAKELDALVAAYLAWLAFNRPGQIVQQGDFVLPAPE
jgi:hypothetical protein